MKCTQLFLILFGIFLTPISSRHVEFYRKDYTYIKEFDAFYKMHWDLNGRSWDSAFLTCDDEEATLFYPEAKEESKLLKNLINTLAEKPNVTEIFIGIHDKFILREFITVDGHSTPYPLPINEIRFPEAVNCVTMKIETGQLKVRTCMEIHNANTPLPFVCKKVNNELCPTVDSGYKYSKAARKCYKVNKRQKMWQEAMQTCFMEGGVLAVIENRAEADVVKEMINEDQRHFVGVQKLYSGSAFYTVKGQKFSDLYQMPEDINESHNCGAVMNNRNYALGTTTADCNTLLPFICEINVA